MNVCLMAFCLAFGGGGVRAPDPPPRERLIAEDKLKHFFVSFITTSLAASTARAAGADDDTSLLIGAGVGTAVGAAKELNDRRGGTGTASALDFAWDLAGVGAGVAVARQAR